MDESVQEELNKETGETKLEEYNERENNKKTEYKRDLKRGYSLLLFGLVFTIIDEVLTFANSIGSIQTAKDGTFSQSCCLLDIFGLIAIAMIVGGIYLIYISKEYFVRKHKKNIEIAGKIFLLLVLLVFFSLIVSTALLNPIILYENETAAFESLKNIFLVSPIMALLIGLCSSIMYIYLIKELVSKKIEYIMWSGLVVRALGPLSAIFYVFLNINEMDFTKASILSNLEIFLLLVNVSIIGSILILVGLVVFSWNKEERLEEMERESFIKENISQSLY